MHNGAWTHGRAAARVRQANCKIIGLSVDPVSNHSEWAIDIEQTQGHRVNYPMIGDPQLKIAKLYGMLAANAGDSSEGRTASDNAPARTVFVIGPSRHTEFVMPYATPIS